MNNIKYFYKNNNYIGFAGNIKVLNNEIYINTETGAGFDKVIKKLKKLINYLAQKYKINDYTFEDRKQQVIVYILEGIKIYDPRKNMKLSTFLQMRISRRILNEIRKNSGISFNPTILRTHLYSVICKCGEKDTIVISFDESIMDKKCKVCNNNFKKMYHINIQPKLLDDILIKYDDDIEIIDDIMSDTNIDLELIYGKKIKLDDIIINNDNFSKLLNNQDKNMISLINMVCFKNYSISNAAKKIGISGITAKNKFKRLRKNKIIQEIIGG